MFFFFFFSLLGIKQFSFFQSPDFFFFPLSFFSLTAIENVELNWYILLSEKRK